MALVRSLRARVVLWVSVALVVLFAVTSVVLDLAFRNSIDQARRELLEVQVLGLIALAETDSSGELTLPTDSHRSAVRGRELGRLRRGVRRTTAVRSGNRCRCSAAISRSTISPVAGEERFERLDVPGFPPLEALLMGIDVGVPGRPRAPTTRSRSRCRSSRTTSGRRRFARILIGWFCGITLTMLVVVSGLLTFVLLPLRRLERQVREVEAGERVKLTGRYPSEIVGLADNLNTLIDTERRRLARYRNTLDDLAHSLKTPLAAMRTLLAEQTIADRRSRRRER